MFVRFVEGAAILLTENVLHVDHISQGIARIGALDIVEVEVEPGPVQSVFDALLEDPGWRLLQRQAIPLETDENGFVVANIKVDDAALPTADVRAGIRVFHARFDGDRIAYLKVDLIQQVLRQQRLSQLENTFIIIPFILIVQ